MNKRFPYKPELPRLDTFEKMISHGYATNEINILKESIQRTFELYEYTFPIKYEKLVRTVFKTNNNWLSSNWFDMKEFFELSTEYNLAIIRAKQGRFGPLVSQDFSILGNMISRVLTADSTFVCKIIGIRKILKHLNEIVENGYHDCFCGGNVFPQYKILCDTMEQEIGCYEMVKKVI